MSFQCRINMLKKQLIQLIKARGAIAQEITDYNFRSYFVRRANEDVETLEKRWICRSYQWNSCKS